MTGVVLLFPEHETSFRSGMRQAYEDSDQHQPESPPAKLERVRSMAIGAGTGTAAEAYWFGYAHALEMLIDLNDHEAQFPLHNPEGVAA